MNFRKIGLPIVLGIALGASLSKGFDPKSETKPVSAQKVRVPKREVSAVPKQMNWGLARSASDMAWKITEGSDDIVVAIIDTGVDVTHPDLKANLWTNEREIPNNGIDDDMNGFIDDVYGWNFVDMNGDVKDRHGHGTHIAGIVGATGERAISGVAKRVKLMTLKYYDPYSPEQNPLTNTVHAIYYAVKMGAKIINYSGGGINPNAAEKEAIRFAQSKGVLFVAAAGNEKSNSDLQEYFPADYELSNILSVTAIDRANRILPSSNYGERTVDIAAPGHQIMSTLPNHAYGEMTGTSQATAFATGAAVLLMASRNDLQTPEAVIQQLMASGERDGKYKGKTKSRAVLNSLRALAMHQPGEDVGLIVE